MSKRLGIIAVCAAGIVSALIVASLIAPRVNRQSVQNEEQTVKTEAGTEINKPTFMYFVTNKEEKETAEVIKKLEDEFGSRVIFQIKNISKDKKLVDSFPVKDNTPALIMMDSKGDIAGILFKTVEYEKLKAAIEGTL